MYSEQMMREQGFDDAPNFRLAMYTDAIWRACRIILDVRMHRGELSVDEATEFLISNTSFEGANARAEVNRYTTRRRTSCRTCSARSLLLQLRADEQRRPRPALRPGAFHDTLLNNGSLPISFHRRLLRETIASVESSGGSAAAGRARSLNARCVQVIPSIDVAGGRSRVVFWPGVAPASAHPPTGPTGSPSGSSSWAPGRPHRRLRRRAARQPGQPRRRRRDRLARRVPIQLAGGLEGADQIRLAFAPGRRASSSR
jgi:hypothetical protein